MKDIRSTVMQLSGRWGNTCYATLCLAVEAALDLPYGDVQMKHLWSAIHERTGKSPQAISRALARAAADVWERGNRELLEAIFARTLKKAPTAKELVFTLAEYVRPQLDFRCFAEPKSGEFGIVVRENYEPVFYEPECREDFFSRGFDYIADCIDSTRSKLDLIETAIRRGVPIISSMGTGNRLDPSKFRITDLSKTSGCPLAKVMRRELRLRGINHHTVLASDELPSKPRKLPGQQDETRTPPGSVSWTPPCAGMMIAGFIVRQLLARAQEQAAPNE